MGGEMVGVGEISGGERWGNGKMLLPLQKQRIEDVKQLVIRTLSGIVYVALIVGAILLLDNSPIAFLLLFSAVIVIALKEYYHLSHGSPSESWLVTGLDMAGGVGLLLSMYMLCGGASAQWIWLLPIVLYVPLRLWLQLYRPHQHAARSLECSMMGYLYIALPIALLCVIQAITSPRLLLAVFVFIWVNDTGAFLAGSMLGKHRLFERISPKKSWEGFIGGMLACVLAAWAMAKWCNELMEVPPMGVWMGLAVLVSASATVGDLIESLLKRTAGVKDSGNLIPGHGGLLDRIDSLLVVSPAVVAFLILINYNGL